MENLPNGFSVLQVVASDQDQVTGRDLFIRGRAERSYVRHYNVNRRVKVGIHDELSINASFAARASVIKYLIGKIVFTCVYSNREIMRILFTIWSILVKRLT